jgi:hypothetical protein
MKFVYRYYKFDKAIIDKYLKDPKTVVTLNVDHGYHWVFLLGSVPGGYKCSDPYPLPSVDRTYHYDDIEGFSVLQKK